MNVLLRSRLVPRAKRIKRRLLTLIPGIALTCLFSNSFLHAQWYDPSRASKKLQKLYADAITKAGDGYYQDALQMLEQCIRQDPKHVDSYLSMAGVYGQLKDYQSSVSFYEQAFALDSVYTQDFKLSYSINLAGLGQFQKAQSVINILLDHKDLDPRTRKAAEYRKRCYDFAVEYAASKPVLNYLFSPVNMGKDINTNESEYFPSLTIDGKELVFTRRLNGFNEDFFSSTHTGDHWTPAAPLPGNVNTPQNEGAQNISQDGQWLVFTGCNRKDGWGGCDLYISYLTPQGWSEAINLGGKINSDQWDSQPCLSPDKRDLYFASRRFGGYGGSDIYVCHMQSNGKWSDPENLGPGINTAGDEASPFIHADNQTLFFTSSGLQGYGDEDFFMCRKGPRGDWSVPLNLGYPINTIDREGTLFIASDGKTAYFASDRADSYGGLDIYTFELREDIRPYKTLWVRGNVFDKKTGKGLPSAVELIDLRNNQLISKVQTDETGNYLITLPVGKDYAFNVHRQGYLFYSDNYSLKDRSPDSTYEKNIPLQPLEVNATVVLNNIFFDSNQFDLQPESETELDKLVQLLQENKSLKIEISGHTDNVGKPADNLALSNNRARAVVNYLIEKGIPAIQLSFKGYGETQPVADNGTEQGRAKNRRTELKVVGQ